MFVRINKQCKKVDFNKLFLFSLALIIALAVACANEAIDYSGPPLIMSVTPAPLGDKLAVELIIGNKRSQAEHELWLVDLHGNGALKLFGGQRILSRERVSWSGNGEYLAYLLKEDQLCIYDLRASASRSYQLGNDVRAFAIALSHDGQDMILADSDGLKVMNVVSQQMRLLDPLTSIRNFWWISEMGSIIFEREGTIFSSGLDSDTSKVIFVLPRKRQQESWHRILINDDGTFFAWEENNLTRVYSLNPVTGSVKRILEGDYSPCHLLDGKLLIKRMLRKEGKQTLYSFEEVDLKAGTFQKIAEDHFASCFLTAEGNLVALLNNEIRLCDRVTKTSRSVFHPANPSLVTPIIKER